MAIKTQYELGANCTTAVLEEATQQMSFTHFTLAIRIGFAELFS